MIILPFLVDVSITVEHKELLWICHVGYGLHLHTMWDSSVAYTNFWLFSGAMHPERLNDVADGSSNVREVWKFSFK
jgi:hypothetical protein